MNDRLKRLAASTLCTTAVVAGTFFAQASPALAACLTKPATNPIFIDTGDGNVLVIPGTSEATVACADVSVDGSLEVDTEPTVKVGEGCGVPCFAVGWDGVTVPTITISVALGEDPPTTISLPVGNVGAFCVNSGVSC